MSNAEGGEAQLPNAVFTSQYDEVEAMRAHIHNLRFSSESQNYRVALEIERANRRIQELENSPNPRSASRNNALSRFIDPSTRHQHHVFPVRLPRDPRGREGRYLRHSLESERPSAVNHRSQEDTRGPNLPDTPNENTPLIRIQPPSPVRRNLTTPSFLVVNYDAPNSYVSVQRPPHIRGPYDISPAALQELNRTGNGILGSVIHRPRPIRRSDSARFHEAMTTPDTPRVTTQPFTALFGSGPPPPQPGRCNGVSRHDIRAVLNWSTRHLEPVAMTQPEGRKDLPEMCCICWDTMGHSDQDHFPVEIANVEGCRGHVFGRKCIVEWLTNGRPMSNTCPVCRTQLVDAHEDTLFLS